MDLAKRFINSNRQKFQLIQQQPSKLRCNKNTYACAMSVIKDLHATIALLAISVSNASNALLIKNLTKYVQVEEYATKEFQEMESACVMIQLCMTLN